MRTVASFRSGAFNTTEPRPYFVNECCYGDDVARWLASGLSARGVKTAEEPGQEDFGWFLGCSLGGKRYDLVIGWQEGDEKEPGRWFVVIEHAVGFFSSIFGGRRRGVGEDMVRALEAVLRDTPAAADVRWHEAKTFLAGKDEEGASEP